MAFEKKGKFTTPVGIAKFPSLTRPDTKFDKAGVYKTGLICERDDPKTQALIEKLEAARDEYREARLEEAKPAERKKMEKYTVADVCEEEVDDEGEATGRVIFKAKMRASFEDKDTGEVKNLEPRIFDAKNKPIKNFRNLRLFGGSQIALAGEIKAYDMPSAKQFGISLNLKAVQIRQLAEGGDGESFGFGEDEDGFEASGAESMGNASSDSAAPSEGEDSEEEDDF